MRTARFEPPPRGEGEEEKKREKRGTQKFFDQTFSRQGRGINNSSACGSVMASGHNPVLRPGAHRIFQNLQADDDLGTLLRHRWSPEATLFFSLGMGSPRARAYSVIFLSVFGHPGIDDPRALCGEAWEGDPDHVALLLVRRATGPKQEPRYLCPHP